MKIASNKLSDLYRFYESELNQLYEESELYALFELVCETYLQFTKQEVKSHFNDNINQSDLLKIYDACLELKKGIPVQYVLKQAFFYDSFFEVSPSVLIPRPETEELVQLIIDNLKLKTSTSSLDSIDNLTFLDIGTGSGCIPITLKKQFPYSSVSAIDISETALNIATKNALQHQVDIHFIQQDILNENAIKNSNQLNSNKLFDVIVSNPPYVLQSEKVSIENHVLQHEPHLALFVEDSDPIIFYKRIIDFCHDMLKPNGYLYFELNPLFADDVNNYAINSNLFTFTSIINDMSGKKRFLKAQKK